MPGEFLVLHIMEKYNKGICGFQNVGNTCYFNSALQCLLNSDNFNEYIIKDYPLHKAFEFLSGIRFSTLPILDFLF